VGDALSWEGADESLLAGVSDIEDFHQYLVRALIYRIVTDAIFRGGLGHQEQDPFLSPVELACDLAQDAQ
jgi:hypothetical protein